MKSPHLTVITATHQRAACLAHTCRSVVAQAHHLGLRVEHLVVADGHCENAAQVAADHGATYLHTPTHRGLWGAACKDLGLARARGDYVCFWDDDNIYHPHALATQYATAYGYGIGINRVRLREVDWLPIPRAWEGRFRQADIDTACVCVVRSLAMQEQWQAHEERDNDFAWLTKLAKHRPTVNYTPIIVADHI